MKNNCNAASQTVHAVWFFIARNFDTPRPLAKNIAGFFDTPRGSDFHIWLVVG